MNAVTYPEHEKLKALNGHNQAVGEFLDWLSENGYVIAKWDGRGDRLVPTNEGFTTLMARHFEIDERRLEDEKQQMLDSLHGGAA